MNSRRKTKLLPLLISMLIGGFSLAGAKVQASTEKTKTVATSPSSKKHTIHIAPPAQPLSSQGERLLQIERLAEKNFVQAEQMATEFTKTPLEAFARFQLLKSSVDDSKQNTAISQYLTTFPDTGWANQLAQRWAEQLESRQDWTNLISHQENLLNGSARCSVLSAQFATGFLDNNQWSSEVASRWLVDQKPSASCNALYQRLETSQMLSDVQWEQKLKQLYDSGRIDEAARKQSQLSDVLKTTNQTMLSLLSGDLNAHAQRLINSSVFTSREQDAEAFMWVIQQLLKQDANNALALWTSAKSTFKFGASDQAKVEKRLYLQLAKAQPEQKLSWFTKIDASVHDETTLLPLLQLALRESDWKQLIQLTNQLPTEMPQEAWTYWRAKALMQTNQAALAQPLLEKLALQRSYYGFMAADLLGKDYQLNTQQVTGDQLKHAHQSALGQRLQALYEVGLKDVAWREWLYARNHQKVSAEEIPGYAQLAQSIGWHSFAVHALGKPEHWNYTTLRFSTPYQDIVRPNADQHNISLAWAYGIMRRESAYAHDVKSSAGAMGLMQLMPKTAKALAPIQQLKDVYQPELNVQLGTKLLGQLKKEFNGNLVLATASYNAGGFRVRQWLKQQPTLPTDQWIELIPFKETREYVKAVLEYMLVFERKGLTSEHTRLADYLIPLNTQLANIGKSCNPADEWCL